MILVKWGGSLITDKTQRDVSRPRRIARLARDVRTFHEAGGKLVLGHGSGSFGHAAAKRAGLQEGPVERDAMIGVTRTQERAAALHGTVRHALMSRGVPAFSVAPSSCAHADAGRLRRFRTDALRTALAAGAVPLTYGDVVADRAWGASICSTETALVAIARSLSRAGVIIRRAIWMGETDGVLDPDGRTIRRLRLAEIPRWRKRLSGAAGPDVTGGIRHRLDAVAALARRGIPSCVVDGRPDGALLAALEKNPERGTWVEP